MISNEASFYEFFPFLNNVRGAGIGVGLDNMFDLKVNTQLSKIFLLDIQIKLVLSSRALLSVGTHLHKMLERFPTTELKNFIEWIYVLQTFEDYKKYQMMHGDRLVEIYNPYERLLDCRVERKNEQSLSIRVPKQGLILAGF